MTHRTTFYMATQGTEALNLPAAETTLCKFAIEPYSSGYVAISVAGNTISVAGNKISVAGNTVSVADNKISVAGNTISVADNKISVAGNTISNEKHSDFHKRFIIPLQKDQFCGSAVPYRTFDGDRAQCRVPKDYKWQASGRKNYITLHYTTLHYITLHYITLHYITLHYPSFYYTTLHYITLHYITLHYPSLLYTTLH